ncbi:MAG TPA: PstS family phosphate ABC transporter substrate-binding protein [Verrucomicrobiae bacterium]|jgi:phosphate transport system substrate-binding protein|nr:PstS family phosphate ABC transporter substrate-binding protein [Verrucomicrobiae bacterium]
MKKPSLFLKLILPALLLGGCSGGNDAGNATAPASGAKVVIRGSNTIGEELAPKLIAAYKSGHPGVAFDLESKGTGYGFGNLLVGGCDIAAASREANSNELAIAQDRGIALSNIVIGSYSVAVVANAANPVSELTRAQVRDIFSGTVKNWKEVGGADAPIHLFIRDPISGTYLGFQELALEKQPYALNLKTFTNYEGIADAVAKDPDGIGYTGFNLASATGVKGLKVGGIAPAPDAVNKGQYPYARTLRFYVNQAGQSSAARDFIDFVRSSDGQKTLVAAGYVAP